MRPPHWILSRFVDRIVTALALLAAAVLLAPIVVLAAAPFLG